MPSSSRRQQQHRALHSAALLLLLLQLLGVWPPPLRAQPTTNPHTGAPFSAFTGVPFAHRGSQTSDDGIPPAIAWRDLGEGMNKHCFGFCGGGAGTGQGPCGANGMFSSEMCGYEDEGPGEHVVTLNVTEAGVSAEFTTLLEAIACPVKLCDSWGMPCHGCAEPPARVRSSAQTHQDANTRAELSFYCSLLVVIASVVGLVLKNTRGRGAKAQCVGVTVGIAVGYAALRLIIWPLWDTLQPVVNPAGLRLDPVAALPFAMTAGIASGR